MLEILRLAQFSILLPMCGSVLAIVSLIQLLFTYSPKRSLVVGSSTRMQIRLSGAEWFCIAMTALAISFA
jgi:hypothetical protein